MSDVEIIPYDPERHDRFVHVTFVRSLLEQWPWRLIDVAALVSSLDGALVDADSALVAESGGEILGVGICNAPREDSRGEIVWCYVGYSYRRMGLGTKLCAPAGPAPWVRYYTRATVRIALDHGRELHWAGR